MLIGGVLESLSISVVIPVIEVLLPAIDQIDLDTDRGDNGVGSTSIVK